MKERTPLFRVWDKKKKKWAGELGGYSLADYALKDPEFKDSGLIYCDMEGFSIDAQGSLYLHDECGHSVPCDSKRFEICFEKVIFKESPSRNYLVYNPTP